MDENQIKRINELARKSKTEGLTAEEQAEQKELRDAYRAAFRASLTQQLDHIQVIDEQQRDAAPDLLRGE